ncbi:hypothetical protein J1N35_042923 [Gossypium stocksii]|uniref:NAD(P)H dehydrogenase (quinone) n=1 Tax=Gossypium stocksii TaxID=47602 RepID=A0A9D3U6D4_9ROSI|nr:hypothetical protein J1N35_042923 [Gossypium stocksii]
MALTIKAYTLFGFLFLFLGNTLLELTKEEIDGIQIDYKGISPIPMLNTDLEVDGKYPPVVEAFRQRILVADSILFASPDHWYEACSNIFVT